MIKLLRSCVVCVLLAGCSSAKKDQLILTTDINEHTTDIEISLSHPTETIQIKLKPENILAVQPDAEVSTKNGVTSLKFSTATQVYSLTVPSDTWGTRREYPVTVDFSGQGRLVSYESAIPISFDATKVVLSDKENNQYIIEGSGYLFAQHPASTLPKGQKSGDISVLISPKFTKEQQLYLRTTLSEISGAMYELSNGVSANSTHIFIRAGEDSTVNRGFVIGSNLIVLEFPETQTLTSSHLIAHEMSHLLQSDWPEDVPSWQIEGSAEVSSALILMKLEKTRDAAPIIMQSALNSCAFGLFSVPYQDMLKRGGRGPDYGCGALTAWIALASDPSFRPWSYLDWKNKDGVESTGLHEITHSQIGEIDKDEAALMRSIFIERGTQRFDRITDFLNSKGADITSSGSNEFSRIAAVVLPMVLSSCGEFRGVGLENDKISISPIPNCPGFSNPLSLEAIDEYKLPTSLADIERILAQKCESNSEVELTLNVLDSEIKKHTVKCVAPYDKPISEFSVRNTGFKLGIR